MTAVSGGVFLCFSINAVFRSIVLSSLAGKTAPCHKRGISLISRRMRNMDLLESVFPVALFCLLLFAAFHIFTLPIDIGISKNLSNDAMRWIRIFTWCGLVTGGLWFVALFLAVTGKTSDK